MGIDAFTESKRKNISMTNTNHSDHELIAEAYLSRASELASQEFEYDNGARMVYAQVLATIALAESVLAVADEIRELGVV